MAKRFTDRLVLITGAAGGLGRALALGFAREGARLLVTDMDTKGLEETAALVRKEGTSCTTYLANLAVEAEVHALAQQIGAAHDKLHVLFNNAGIAYGEINEKFETLSQARWLHFFAVNTIAPLLLAQALRAPLAKARGVILNQSSMASWVPGVAYGVTKGALNDMTYGMAHAFGRDGIRVNAIAPGLMETPANIAGLTAEQVARVRGMQLLNLHGKPDHIVSLALFLASDDAEFITCEVVPCDGGNRLRQWRA